MTTTVLTFGHIPKFFGGRQQQGLANAMWAIASHMADCDNYFDVIFCATDIRSRSTRIGDLPVIGWTKASLLAAPLRSPVRSIELGVRVARLCLKYNLPLIRTTIKALHLKQAIAMSAPDYLHLHGCESVVYLEAGVFDPSKTFVTIHGLFGSTGPRNLLNMEKALNRLSLRFISFVTNKIAADWYDTFGFSPTEAVVIPNSFDRSEFFLVEKGARQKGGGKDTYRLILIGSVCDRKGQQRVVEAMIRFKATSPSYEVDFTMIGNGDPELVRNLLSRGADAGIRIHHVPYLSPSEIRAQLSQADFMILPTSNEGFGLVFLESIACGVPVVLPKDLPICEEPGLISDANAVLLDSSSAEAVFAFLVNLPSHSFVDAEVAASLPENSWRDVGARYRALLASRGLAAQNPGRRK